MGITVNAVAQQIFSSIVSTMRFTAADDVTDRIAAKKFGKGKFGGPQCGRQWEFAQAAAKKFANHIEILGIPTALTQVAADIYVKTIVMFRVAAERASGGQLAFGVPQCDREIEFAAKAARATIS